MYKEIQNNVSSNISFSDKILSIFLFIGNKLMWFFYFKKAFRNYLSIIRNIQKNVYPIHAILKNGTELYLNSRNEVSLYSLLEQNKNCTYNPDEDSITLNLPKYKNKSIKLFGIKKNFDTIIALERETYEKIPIKDLIIVDIGTSIGDTPIFFALKGAAIVIGLEPFPQNFEFAKKNVQINNFESKIHLIMAGCSAKSGVSFIDPSMESDMRSKINSTKTGVQIPLMTLENIVEKFNISDGILKIDCEGCEYDVILSAPNEILRKFQYIQTEYHFGYKNLKEKLENAGFLVDITKLESYYKNRKLYFFRGHINALRK